MRGVEKIRRNLQGKFLSAPLAHQVHPRQSKSQFLGHFCWAGRFGGGVVHLVVLDCLLRAIKRSSTFGGKSAPGQNPGYAYEQYAVQEILFSTV